MRLYLVQHGQAKSEAEDPLRGLTVVGAEEVRRVAQLAVDRGSVTPERIFHSGKTRAEQTAALWGEILRVPIEPADGLAPLDDPTTWGAELTGATTDLMLVGHQPHLAKLAGLLLTGDPERSVVAFVQGGLAGLEQGPGGWFVWLLLPPASV